MEKFITLICLLCFTMSVPAQNNGFLVRDIRLPAQFNQQIITTLEQDKSGMLWFATNNGLYRFDGNNVVHLGPESNPVVPHADLNTLFADKQNNLWIGAEDGLTRLNLNTWVSTEIKVQQKPTASGLYIRTIAQGKNGDIYMGAQGGKVFRVKGDSLELVFDINQSLPGSYGLQNINFIKAPYPSQLWIGTSTGKLIRLTIKDDGSFEKPDYYGLDLPNAVQISSATFSANGKCLMAILDRGIYILDIHIGIFKKLRGKYGDLGKDGQVFLAPLDADKVLILSNTPSNGARKLLVYDFKEDKVSEQGLRFPNYLRDSHIVWFSHTGSMIVLSLNDHLVELAPSRTLFKAFMTDSRSLNSIRAIYKQHGGNLFIGSYKDGFETLNEENGEKSSVLRKYVYNILHWNKDTLLLSTEGIGLFWYEIKKNKLSHLDIPAKRTIGKLMGTYLTYLVRHSDHQVVVGTYEGLYMVDPYKRTAMAVREDQLFKIRVLGLLKRGENYYIATEKGILSWNSQTDSVRNFWNYEGAMGQSKISVYGMIPVGHQIWAGTKGKGIVILNKEGIMVDSIGHAKGLAANIVFTLIGTSKYVLAGTKNGLSVINKKTRAIENYSTLDQLPANEFNSAASFRDGNVVYLGTINGVVRFNTDQLKDPKTDVHFIPLYITDLSITNRHGETLHDYTLPYHHQNPLKIPSGTEYFSIDFGGLGGPSQNLSYYYHLQEGDHWSVLGATSKLTFVDMSPGQYQLQICARLPDGKWTKLLLSVPLSVKAAFYQTIWFKVLIGLLIMGIGWWVFRYRERQKDKERQLRLKIAGDLHDEVGSALAGISMQADMLLSGHADHAKEYLQSIAENGRMAVQTMGDIVWSIDSRNDDSVSLVKRMERYGQKAFGASDTTITFHNVGFNESQYIPQIVRQNVMLIFKETLTNIVKHAQASRVDVRFTALKNGFELRIADDGRGIATGQVTCSDEVSNGHGLRNIQMRADAIGAAIKYPPVEKGVTMVLLLED